MDLKEFVRETLVQIVAGVAEAQQDKRRGSAKFAPKMAHREFRTEVGSSKRIHSAWKLDPDNLKGSGLLITEGDGIADIIEFDVAVTLGTKSANETEEGSEKKGGLSIQVLSAGIDASKKTTKAKDKTVSHETRVKFRVPVQFSQ